MKWEGNRESNNVEDRRGGGGLHRQALGGHEGLVLGACLRGGGLALGDLRIRPCLVARHLLLLLGRQLDRLAHQASDDVAHCANLSEMVRPTAGDALTGEPHSRCTA